MAKGGNPGHVLDRSHPDHDRKVGDKREAHGLTWTFFANQYSIGWNGGVRGGSVYCDKDWPRGSKSPYRVYSGSGSIGMGVATLERGAELSMKDQAKKYEKAKKLVADWEESDA